MRFHWSLTNMIALPLAVSYSQPFYGEEGGTEVAIFIGPILISVSWG